MTDISLAYTYALGVSSSRLALDSLGRTVVIVTTPACDIEVGHVFVVLDGTAWGLVPERGRLATPQERAAARPPYQDPRAARKQWGEPSPAEPELDEQAAIAAAYAEQRRAPADLLAAA